MLELNKNSIITINNLKDFITVTYDIIYNIYQKVTPAYIKYRRNIDKALMSDSEIITLSLVDKLLTIDSEKAWLGFCRKNLTDLFSKFCTRIRFHRTRKSLFKIFEVIRKELTNFLNYQHDQVRVLDSICLFPYVLLVEHTFINLLSRKLPAADVFPRKKLTMVLSYMLS